MSEENPVVHCHDDWLAILVEHYVVHTVLIDHSGSFVEDLFDQLGVSMGDDTHCAQQIAVSQTSLEHVDRICAISKNFKRLGLMVLDLLKRVEEVAGPVFLRTSGLSYIEVRVDKNLVSLGSVPLIANFFEELIIRVEGGHLDNVFIFLELLQSLDVLNPGFFFPFAHHNSFLILLASLLNLGLHRRGTILNELVEQSQLLVLEGACIKLFLQGCEFTSCLA